MDVRQMREIPIVDFLNAMGFIRPNRKETPCGIPLRTARSGHLLLRSIRIKTCGLTLASAKVGTSSTWQESLSGVRTSSCGRLSSQRAEHVRIPLCPPPQRNEEKAPVFEDIGVRPLQDTRLLEYLEERGINATLPYPTARR